MLARAYRLRSNADFDRTYKYGRSANAQNFYIKFYQSHYITTRIAVVVSKKISKRAVVRNRCKRRLVELARNHFDELLPGYNVIVMAKTDVSNLLSKDLEREFMTCLSKAGLLVEGSK